jgi:hypothetical protein
MLFSWQKTTGIILIVTAGLITGCSQAELDAPPMDAQIADESGGTATNESALAPTPNSVISSPTPAPTATEQRLRTEIIEEPVSPVNTPGNAMSSNNDFPPGSEQPVMTAVNDLAEKTGNSPDQITVVSVELSEWSDASLGCPQEGMMYAQVITPGFLIFLEADGQQYEYHTNQTDGVVLCNQ